MHPPRWPWRALGYVWALVHTVIGLLLAVGYWPRSVRWSDGCLEIVATRIIGSPAAQTHGWLIYYRSAEDRERPRLRVHERVHVGDGMVGGPFYLLAYVVCFLWFWAAQGFCDWKAAYRRNPFEVRAYRVADEWAAGLRPGAWGV